MSLLNEAEKAPKASEADWDRHKETIRGLYCIEDRDLKGLDGVQEEMKRRHQFDVDTYQYEKHFKRWKFRKNLKKEEWIPIKQKILARKREGKDSDIYLEGVLVPAKKVKRGVGRCRRADDEINLFSHDCASIPPTPEGITIATPTPIEDSSNAFGDLPISHYFAALLHQASPQGHNTIHPASTFEWSLDISVPFTSMPKVITSSPGILSVDCTAPATGFWIPNLGTETDDAFPQGLELFHMLPDHAGALRALQFMIFFVSNGYLNSANYSVHNSIVEWLRQEDNSPLLRRLLSVGGPTAESTLETLYPYAVKGQKASIVKTFLDLGCDPNISLKNDRRPFWDYDTTALGLACENGNLELVRVLLAAGANPNQLSEPVSTRSDHFADGSTEGQCPMVLSIWRHAYSCSTINAPEEDRDDTLLPFIESLIQEGALVHGPSSVCHLPLIEAVRFGHESVIRLLLEAGADVNLPDGLGRLPLAIAIEHLEFGSPAETTQSLFIIRLLLGAGAGVNTPSRCDYYFDDNFSEFRDPDVVLPFDIAAAKGSLKLVEFLYSADARPSRFALAYAIEGKNVDVVKFTLEVGTLETGIPAQRSALVQAIESEEAEMFRLVFGSGAEQQDSETLSLAVKTAIDEEMYDVVPQLLVAGLRYPSFTMKLQPAVLGAVSSGNVEILELLLGTGVKASSEVLVQAFDSKDEPMIEKVLNMRTLQPFNETEGSGDQDDLHASCNFEECHLCGRKADCRKISPLIAAARFGNCDIVKRLLEQGALLTGPKALVCAIRCKNLEMVATLLEAGSPINASACDHWFNSTPLQAAVRTRQLSLVRLLLNNGANPELSPFEGSRIIHNYEPRESKPPLQLAVSLGDREIAMMLLRAGADINNPHAKAWACSALSLAIRSYDQQMLDLVVAHGADTLESTALLDAVKQKNISLVRGLLTSSSRVGQRYRGTFGNEALCEAIRQKSMDLVQLLLSAGIDPNKRLHGMTALGVAITHVMGPAMEIVETLLQAGADPNGLIEPSGCSGGTRTALVAAARTGEVSLVALLIQHGANLNEHPKGAISRSPLQAACEEGKLRVVQLLLNHDVDVNAPPAWHNGGTALQLAAINGNPGIVLALLKRGADVNAPAARVNGRTALEGAAENGRLDTVRALLDAGVGIHGPYRGQYNRALQFAKENGFLCIQRELVARAEASS